MEVFVSEFNTLNYEELNNFCILHYWEQQFQYIVTFPWLFEVNIILK